MLQDQAAKLRKYVLDAYLEKNDKKEHHPTPPPLSPPSTGGMKGGGMSQHQQFAIATGKVIKKSGKRTIAITSGKGGVGKTNFTANLGISLSIQGGKVVIIDADLGLANIDVIFRLSPKFNLRHVIAGEKTISEIMIEGPFGVMIIPASSGVEYLANLPQEKREKFIEELFETTEEADFLLIDTAAGISQNVLSFATAAEEVIVITTPEPTSITDAYAMIKVLFQREHSNIKLLVNMAFSANQAKEVAEKINLVVKQFLKKEIDFLGYILEDENMPQAVKEQKPLILLNPNSKAARCITNIASKIKRHPG